MVRRARRAARASGRGRTRPSATARDARARRRVDARDIGAAFTRPAARARRDTARASRAPLRRRSSGALATKRSFASIPSARAISFRIRTSSASTSPPSPASLGPDDRLEDAPLVVARQLDPHAASPEDASCFLHAVEGAEGGGVRRVGLGPWRRRSGARLRFGKCDQISSVTCGIMRVQQSEQELERAQCGRTRVGLAVVEARLDGLGIPVAEVVERQVVEDACRRREVEPRPCLLDCCPRCVDPREDPALLERGWPRLWARRPPRSGGSGARRSRACSRACAPPRPRRPRSGRPGSRRS